MVILVLRTGFNGPKKRGGDIGKEKEIPVEYNRAKCSSASTKLWFDKAIEIDKKL